MSTWVTPTWPIVDMMDDRIKGDAPLAAVLQGAKVYNTTVGELRPKPYIVLAHPTEIADNKFQQKGHLTTYELHIVGANNSVVLSIYNMVKRLFDGVKLPLTDHTMVRGTTELVATFPLEDLSGDRAIVNYTVQSIAA